MPQGDGQQRDNLNRTLTGVPPPHYECSFCGKGREEVEHLIAGPRGVYICSPNPLALDGRAAFRPHL